MTHAEPANKPNKPNKPDMPNKLDMPNKPDMPEANELRVCDNTHLGSGVVDYPTGKGHYIKITEENFCILCDHEKQQVLFQLLMDVRSMLKLQTVSSAEYAKQ